MSRPEQAPERVGPDGLLEPPDAWVGPELPGWVAVAAGLVLLAVLVGFAVGVEVLARRFDP